MTNENIAVGIIKRAYEVAASGQCEKASDISKSLMKEGFTRADIEDYLNGRSIRAELKAVCRDARQKANQSTVDEHEGLPQVSHSARQPCRD